VCAGCDLRFQTASGAAGSVYDRGFKRISNNFGQFFPVTNNRPVSASKAMPFNTFSRSNRGVRGNRPLRSIQAVTSPLWGEIRTT